MDPGEEEYQTDLRSNRNISPIEIIEKDEIISHEEIVGDTFTEILPEELTPEETGNEPESEKHVEFEENVEV